ALGAGLPTPPTAGPKVSLRATGRSSLGRPVAQDSGRRPRPAGRGMVDADIVVGEGGMEPRVGHLGHVTAEAVALGVDGARGPERLVIRAGPRRPGGSGVARQADRFI